jgi:2-aminoethylphosphonate-pyruvate transaminase
MKKTILLNPGPACTSHEVKKAMIEIGDVCPREVEIGNLMESISYRIKYFLSSRPSKYECALLTSSGTGAVEMVISSLPKDAYVLNIINGSYGERIEEMLQVYNIPHDTLNYQEGEIHIDEVKTFLNTQTYTHVSVIHCETTTGILNDIEKIASLASANGTRIIVDAMSSAFAYPIDMYKHDIDILCCSSNKLVQGMAGLGIVIIDKKVLAECYPRTVYLDLKSQIEYFNSTNQMRFTSPVQILNALSVALDELSKEGLNMRFCRYKHLNEIIRDGMETLGFVPLVEREKNSIVITSFIEPKGFDFNEFHDYLKTKGFIIYPGKVAKTNTFRLSNIGDINEYDVTKFLTTVTSWVKKKQKELSKL